MKSAQLLQNAATGVLVVCAVVVTGLLVRRELASGPAGGGQNLGQLVPEWREFARGPHRGGPADAPVVIVEFSDFQCPFCRTLASQLDSIRAENPRSVAVVYRHHPLPSHPHARTAALASECAASQGRFWAMHDALFAGQDSIGVRGWTQYASAAGVPDSLAFHRCMEGNEGEAAIREDLAASTRLNVDGTPTILINQFRVNGTPPLDTLRAYVRRAYAAAGKQ